MLSGTWSFLVNWLRPLLEVGSDSVGAVQIPQAWNTFLDILIFPSVTFSPIVLSLFSLDFYQTVRHSPGEISCDIAPDNSRGCFVAWWKHLRVIRMWIGWCCFASEFPHCGQPIVWRLVWKSIGSWSMQTKCPRRNRLLAVHLLFARKGCHCLSQGLHSERLFSFSVVFRNPQNWWKSYRHTMKVHREQIHRWQTCWRRLKRQLSHGQNLKTERRSSRSDWFAKNSSPTSLDDVLCRCTYRGTLLR